MADADEDREADDVGIRVVGGCWPADGHPWRLSHDDAVLFVDADELELLVDPVRTGGDEVPVGVDTEEGGRRRLRAPSDPGLLCRLPRCDEPDST
jgi:hypothetical protein